MNLGTSGVLQQLERGLVCLLYQGVMNATYLLFGYLLGGFGPGPKPQMVSGSKGMHLAEMNSRVA